MDIFFLFWCVEVVHKVCPLLSVTPCIGYSQILVKICSINDITPNESSFHSHWRDSHISAYLTEIATYIWYVYFWMKFRKQFLIKDKSAHRHFLKHCSRTTDASSTGAQHQVLRKCYSRILLYEVGPQLTPGDYSEGLHLLGYKAVLPAPFWSPAGLTLRPWRWRWYVAPKRQLTFTGSHCVISQKILFFICTAVHITIN
jgi:hypothetical protein